MSDVKIVGLLCNWCCYGGADTAGTARMQYPPNIRIIRVMCSGRINPSLVFKAFKEGADGVLKECNTELNDTKATIQKINDDGSLEEF